MDNQNEQNPFLSVHTPIALVALALSVLFFNQIKGSGQANDAMIWQKDTADKQKTGADKQIKELKETITKAEDVIKKQNDSVAQSEQTQKQFSDLMKELDELSRAGDKDAQQVMQVAANNGINFNPTPAAADSTEKKPDVKAPEKKDEKAK